jgi:hypothetical protein
MQSVERVGRSAARHRRRRPGWRRSRRAAPAALVLCLVGCYNEPPENLAVWSEFLPFAEVQAHLPTLARFGADLYVAVRPDDLGDELAMLFAQAGAAGVEVRAWLQLPESGVWVNEGSAADFADFAAEFLDFAAANGIKVEWIVFDLEPPFELAEKLREAAAAGGLEELIGLLIDRRDPVRFEAARLVLRQLVDELHGAGLKAMAVTLPWTIDDLEDGDDDLQDLFETPLAGIPWDQVSVIVYRPAMSELLSLPLPAAYVASYGESMRLLFGGNAQLAIGNISTPGLLVASGYADPFDIALDVSAARSAGITDLSVFSLDGMVLEGGPEVWLAAATGPTLSFSRPAPLVAAIRFAFGFLDRAADDL